MKTIKELIKRVLRKIKAIAIMMQARVLAGEFSKKARAEGKRYVFSVIIPVYNTEKYVAEAIESVLQQSTGHSISQIILINDGSSDGSEAICLSYQKRYPDNIVYLSQENAGVSAARNKGIDIADGVYLNFLDSDDKWEKNSFYYTLKFLKDYDFPDIAAAKETFFEAQKGPHPRNYIFEKDRLLDLEKEWWGAPIAASQTFFKYSVVGDLRFQKGLKHSEDARFSSELLLKTNAYGAMSKPTYMYRKRKTKGSSSNKVTSDPHYYTDAITMYHDYMIARSEELRGDVPKFIQYALAYNIGWRVRENAKNAINDPKLLEAYRSRLIDILQKVDDQVIAAQKHLTPWQRLYMYSLKYGLPMLTLMDSLERNRAGEVYCFLEGSKLVIADSDEIEKRCKIEFITIDEDNQTVTVEGTFVDARCAPEKLRAELRCNGKKYNAEVYPRKHGKQTLPFEETDMDLFQLHFRSSLPLQEHMEICVYDAIIPQDLGILQKAELTFGTYAFLDSKLKSSYCIKNGRIYSYKDEDGTLLIDKGDESLRGQYERKVVKELKNSKKGEKWLPLRQYGLEHLHDETALWLFTDRMTSAEDSGEELFRYVLAHPIPNVEIAFVIRADVPDFERLSKLGHVIPFNSEEHLYAMMRADKLISSAADGPVINPFGKNIRYVKDLLHYDFVFLQHGVIKDDLSDWLHRANKNIQLFVTSAERERQAILSDPYGYNRKQIILTGLPRFDKLLRKDHPYRGNSIYIMPTWREWLAPEFDIRAETVDGIQTKNGDFQESDYFQFYNGLLSSKRMHQLLEKYDIHLFFALHPRMGAEMYSFYSDKRVHLLKPESFVYGDAFKEMRLLITDYSSVAFNVALLKKPVVYTQFDYEEFYESEKHTSRPGYFSFKDDGFGPVVTTVEQALDEIEKIIGNSYSMEDVYKKRAEEFFFYPPNGMSHCEMVVRHILADG